MPTWIYLWPPYPPEPSPEPDSGGSSSEESSSAGLESTSGYSSDTSCSVDAEDNFNRSDPHSARHASDTRVQAQLPWFWRLIGR